MPIASFEALPDTSRVWVFAADRPVRNESAERLLAETDAFLSGWAAHGVPLTCARDWRENRFLTVAVDQRAAGASGCSIDGLFRALRALEPSIGASLIGGGLVYWRDASGTVRGASRDEFVAETAAGNIGAATPVFDPTLTELGDWRERFEVPMARSWHAQLG